MSGTLRILPLGGVGEIGKNMTVVEYDGRIVVVDAGPLRLPMVEADEAETATVRAMLERHGLLSTVPAG